MKALIQRVKSASVTISGALYSEINFGLLILVGVTKDDTSENAENLAQKVLKLRIFEDENDKMNLSVTDKQGDILVVSQFTLCGNCKKGTRPSFDEAARPEVAVKLYEEFVEKLKASGLNIKTGKFQTTMDVALVNDGPVTFMVEK